MTASIITGDPLCVSEWAEQLGIRAGKIYKRLYAGKSHVEALS